MKFAIVLSALFLSACVALIPIVESKPVPLSTAQLKEIESTMSHNLFDPSSAQFRNVRATDVVLQDGTRERRVCGEMNAKNRMGGYVGFEYFGGTMENGKFVNKDFFSACEPW
jgi:hypothetical protein